MKGYLLGLSFVGGCAVITSCVSPVQKTIEPISTQIKRIVARKTGKNLYSPEESWKFEVQKRLALLGQSNWIIITEAAFPSLNRSKMTQITSSKSIDATADFVLSEIEKTESLVPVVYQTRELSAVDENFAPDIKAYRGQLKKALHGHETTELDQQSLITLVQSAQKKYEVLVIKTKSQIPYGSVFFELRSGYWDGDGESHLRAKLHQ